MAIFYSCEDCKVLERTLSKDMITLSASLQTWWLKLSHAKTVTAAFYLHNRKAKRDLKVNNYGKILPFCAVPTYVGVKLDRTLMDHHLGTWRKKLSTRVSLLRRLAGSGWALVPGHCTQLPCPTVEYCAPAGCCSAHTGLIDSVLNDTFRIVTGCLRPTPTDNLSVLSGIHPAEFRRQEATLSFANRSSLDPGDVLHGPLTESQAASKERLNLDTRLLLPRGNYCTTYLSWASALPNGQTWHGAQSIL